MRSNFALPENFADQYDQDEYDITEVSGSKLWEDIIAAENGVITYCQVCCLHITSECE